MIRISFGVFLVVLLGITNDLVCKESCTTKISTNNTYPEGIIYRDIEIDTVCKMIENAESKDNWGKELLEYYFGEVYIKELPVLIIYMNDVVDTILYQIIQNDNVIQNNRLYGEKNLYVIVFYVTTYIKINNQRINPFTSHLVTDDTKAKTQKSTNQSLFVHWSVLERQQDPFLRRAITALSSLLSIDLTKDAGHLDVSIL
jgi:hypothetical protein